MRNRGGMVVSLETLRLVTRAIEKGPPSPSDWPTVWRFVWECIGKAYENDCMSEAL